MLGSASLLPPPPTLPVALERIRWIGHQMPSRTRDRFKRRQIQKTLVMNRNCVLNRLEKKVVKLRGGRFAFYEFDSPPENSFLILSFFFCHSISIWWIKKQGPHPQFSTPTFTSNSTRTPIPIAYKHEANPPHPPASPPFLQPFYPSSRLQFYPP